MSITLQQVNPLGSRVFMGTITQGTGRTHGPGGHSQSPQYSAGRV